jgi:hypothetical protein
MSPKQKKYSTDEEEEEEEGFYHTRIAPTSRKKTENIQPPEPASVPAPASPRNHSDNGSRVKSLVKLNSISEEDKGSIENELKLNIENPYYKLNDRSKLTYKYPKMKSHTKAGNVFENIEAPPKKSRKTAVTAEPPPPTADIDPVPSVSEVDAVNQQVKPPPVRKRKLDLVREIPPLEIQFHTVLVSLILII